MSDFLAKIRKLNWTLSESTTGDLSFRNLSKSLSEMNEANVYILDRKGKVLGSSYERANDSSTITDETGLEMAPFIHNQMFLETPDTRANLRGDVIKALLGEDYKQKDKYHTIIPCVSGGTRQGTMIITRYERPFSEEEIVLSETVATIISLEIQRKLQNDKNQERNMRTACNMALDTLSFSEKDALIKIMMSFEEDEAILVASKVAVKYKLTNSVIVNALKKLESAGILETKSLGMKGTYIKVLNPYLREIVKNAQI
ncbi:MAG: GTP-sensing pleiotropic transcriptional regulator CodY [Firmicutes bacterium]|nr:GTP-sensing pleiotropic transcriptional regulator CodY [Bacillota bacterium]